MDDSPTNQRKAVMATQPTDQAAAPAAAPAEQTEESGYKICIAVDGQGKISVGVENESAEAPAAPGAAAPAEDEAAEMSAMSPARDIKDALTQALEIYKNNGQVAEGSADADFQAGFGGSQGDAQ